MGKHNHCGVLVILCVMAVLLPAFAIAQPYQEKVKPGAFQFTLLAEVKEEDFKNVEAKINALEAKMKAGEKEFWTNWGVGLIANLSSGQKRPVKSARIVNNTVRIDYEEYFQAGLGLEVHKFLYGGPLWSEESWGTFASEFAVGPYVSIMPGSNGIISSIGGGILFGFHGWRKENKAKSPPAEAKPAEVKPAEVEPAEAKSAEAKSPPSKFSMNLGFGGYAAPNVQVLGDGFEENQPPPAGETQIRYKTVTQYGWQLLLSFSYSF